MKFFSLLHSSRKKRAARNSSLLVSQDCYTNSAWCNHTAIHHSSLRHVQKDTFHCTDTLRTALCTVGKDFPEQAQGKNNGTGAPGTHLGSAAASFTGKSKVYSEPMPCTHSTAELKWSVQPRHHFNHMDI